ncbi:unnamed protein product [Cuscuta epithymum]|uniref:Avr9/Cf-9 rapidly elicited protein 146 n=1 Tax=Cuscuta epithymum TaxID=186058 RepID=A0AAV0EG79_9ASTE|nr:unnamed protein product [Cuscuta epithymum]
MEPNKLPVITKRFWSLVRAALFMLRQGISKRKLMLDLNLKLKRRKIEAARKAAFSNLISSSSTPVATAATPKDFVDPSNAYEFSCDSPAHPAPSAASLGFLNIVIKKLTKLLRQSAAAHSLPPGEEEEMVKAAEEIVLRSAAASPALPGFGATPLVRPLRVTDSPFQSRDGNGGYDGSDVDEDAEKFIRRFYENLRRQCSQ